jgi:uncharacterized protein YbjT (DUF2867 family)
MINSKKSEGVCVVVGATGNVGTAVTEQLLERRLRTRVFTRDAAKMARWSDRVEVAVGDFQRPDTFAQAVSGAEAVFLMSQNPDPQAFARLIDAAKSSGEPRIVFLSSSAAKQPDLQIGVLHSRKEDTIRASGLPAVFLRPGGFMSNSYQWIHSINTEGVVYNALGDTRFPPVAPEDIAAVAVRSLTDPELSGKTFDLTGGELLSVPEQVEILANVLGKPIRSVEITIETAIENLIRAGVPAQIARAVGESYRSVRDGRILGIADSIEKVTGAKPMTFESWARRHTSRFLVPVAAYARA